MPEPLLDDAGESWRDFLDRWEYEVYIPIFQPRGFSRDAALFAWNTNKIYNLIDKHFDGDDADDDEPWGPDV